MKSNADQSGSLPRIAVQCDCGKRVSVPGQLRGKRVKCSACGQPVMVPVKSAGSASDPTAAGCDGKGQTNGAFVMLWCVAGIFVAVAVSFVVWQIRSSNQSRIDTANAAVREATLSAERWLANGPSNDFESIETALTASLANQLVSDKGQAGEALEKVRARRIFDTAISKLQTNAIEEAISLLKAYAENPHATARSDAQHLLAEADIAMSDDLALATLVAMDDEQFDRAKNTGTIHDGKVTHPILAAARNEAAQRNFNKAVQRREEIKTEDEKRREAGLERQSGASRRRYERHPC